MDLKTMMREYDRIMRQETDLRYRARGDTNGPNVLVVPPMEMRNIVLQLREIARSCFVQRSYVSRYRLGPEGKTHESVSAHSNLVAALMDRALRFYYGPDFGEPDSLHPRTIDAYSYRMIMEAMRVHDLPENVMGDIPDNGARDEQAKREAEDVYFDTYFSRFSPADKELATHARRLLAHMDDPKSPTGRMGKVADKVAAQFITLAYDEDGRPPLKSVNDEDASSRDVEEMLMCDWTDGNLRRGSEMWAIDHFHIRRTIELDDTGFFTAVIVMYTLMVHGHWYSWREQDYEAIN